MRIIILLIPTNEFEDCGFSPFTYLPVNEFVDCDNTWIVRLGVNKIVPHYNYANQSQTISVTHDFNHGNHLIPMGDGK